MSGAEFDISSEPPPASAIGPRRAVIDIGTNSVKLLVAELAGGQIHPVLETSEQTRLGRGFYQSHRLQADAIEASLEAVREFARQARKLGADNIRLIATSAVRDAQNAADLTTGIQRATGLNVEIITGEQEADWAFAGVASNPRLTDQPMLVIDAGGGSTEFIYGRGGHARFRRSYPLGTVRLLEQWELADPPSTAQFAACQREVNDYLRNHPLSDLRPFLADRRPPGLKLIGTGGTPAILARLQIGLDDYDRDRIEAVCLTPGDLAGLTNRLWSVPLVARRRLAGLPPKRADVILAGALIYQGMMEVLGFERLEISTRGLRFAVVAAMA